MTLRRAGFSLGLGSSGCSKMAAEDNRPLPLVFPGIQPKADVDKSLPKEDISGILSSFLAIYNFYVKIGPANKFSSVNI